MFDMHIESVYHLVCKLAAARRKNINAYMMENRSHLISELSTRHLYVNDKYVGAREVFATDVTVLGANQMFTEYDPCKTIADHHTDNGCKIDHPELQCLAIRRGSSDYEYFPTEAIFYVAV